jgi:hypothetical protein
MISQSKKKASINVDFVILIFYFWRLYFLTADDADFADLTQIFFV